MKNKTSFNDVSFFKPVSEKTASKSRGVLLCALCLLFVLGSTGLNAQLCRSESFYNDLSWTWSYAGPCTNSYNCLAYAVGVTNQWIWPWSSNATEGQVDSYMKTRGYWTSGTDVKIISYGLSSNSIGHFSRTTSSTTCRAKCGGLNLLDHGSWNPYYNSSSSYGSRRKVYYDNRIMRISITGPTQIMPFGFADWCVDIECGIAPYTYTWYYSRPGTVPTQVGTRSCFLSAGTVTQSGYIEVRVVDSTGQQSYDTLYVTVGSSFSGFEYSALESSVDKDRIAENVYALMDEAAATNFASSNPYDYIKSPFFKQIVEMGPIALMNMRKMILTSKENGLKEYLLAIAVEQIAGVELKGNTFAWTTGKEFCRKWDDHMGSLPVQVAKILRSNGSIDAKNKALVKLGIPAIPLIMDEISSGKNELQGALDTLAKKAGMKKDQRFDTWEKDSSDTLTILRDLSKFYNQK